MTFEEVLIGLRNGNRYKRKVWDKPMWIEPIIEGGKLVSIIYLQTNTTTPKLFHPSCFELLVDDWIETEKYSHLSNKWVEGKKKLAERMEV